MMKWSYVWNYRPVDYGTSIGTIENITQRSYFLNNLSGNKVKLRFSNRFSKEELILEKVVIGQIRPESEMIEEMQVVTYQGEEQIHLGAMEEFYSDEIHWKVDAGTEIVLSIYVKEKTQVYSACSTWSAKSWRTRYVLGGDFTLEQKLDEVECRNVYPYVEADANKANVIVGVSEILIEAEEDVKNITMFGDSITHMSYYSDALLERLCQTYPGKVTVVNRGIGGNRVLHDASYMAGVDGHGNCFGIAGVKRYQEDLFERNEPDTVLILEGVNDLMHPHIFPHNKDDVVSANELIEGITEIINAVKAHGAAVYLGTIMPFKLEEEDWFEEEEATRNQFNEWVRTQTLTDGILDFDQALRDEADFGRLVEEFTIGDGLHPNTGGGIKMASLVPIEMIMKNNP